MAPLPEGIEIDNKETAKTIVEGLTEKERKLLSDALNPYYKGYSSLHEQYGKDERYKDFFASIRLEGKNIILDGKEFSQLEATHNGIDIFSGEHEANGKTGQKGVTYMTGKAAMRESEKQGKKLFETEKEVRNFIYLFPGETVRQKIVAFLELFGLENSGFWNPDNSAWDCVNIAGFATLSSVDEANSVWAVRGAKDTDSYIESLGQGYIQPVIAFKNR